MTRRSAIPVLAYLSSTSTLDGAAEFATHQIEGEMIAKSKEQDAFAIFLHFNAIGGEGRAHEHEKLVLQYDADKIAASLEPKLIQLSTSQLGKLQRQGNAELWTLRLCSQGPCPVLCPKAVRDTIRSSPFLRNVAIFAEAHIVNVVFDINAFGSERKKYIDRLVAPRHTLKGIGIDTTERNYALVDLRHLNVVEEAISDEPPSYEKKQPSTPVGMLAMSINVEGIAGAAANTVLNHLRIESSQLRDVIISVVKNALPDVLLELPSLDNILKPLAEVALDKHFDEALWRAEDGLEETSDNNRTDLELISKDKLHEFNVAVDDKIDEKVLEVEHKITEAVDGLKDQADLVFMEIHERLEGLNGINRLKHGIGDLLKKEEEKLEDLQRKMKRERDKLKRKKEELKWKVDLMGMERKKLEKERKRSRRERKRMKKERLKSAESGFEPRRRG
ncbi:hypothetical protein G6514_009909 [Epicoccum nigrum]|nr:hypothetical protein G6514_009909 [Epicoccum nigrum]